MSIGVYIDMEMPKNCFDCKLCYDAFYCKVLEIGFYDDRDKEYRQEGFDPETARLQGCPLVSVPPHGDLIDRDLFIEFIKTHWDSYDQWFVEQLEARPTIIPAEEGE